MPEETAVKTSESFILFELGTTIYGIPSRCVQQIEMIEKITPVPNALPFVEGVVFSRGQVLPALNLRQRFGFNKIPSDTKTRLIVVSTHSRIVGLIVDTAREFIAIPPHSIHPPPEKMLGLSGNYLQGVADLGKRLVLILNVEEVVNVSTN